jgi:hypothetical protein
MGVPLTSNQCLACKHLLGFREAPGETEEGLPPDTVVYCEAFPNGIPDRITEGFDHTKPFRGDHGIRFESRTPLELVK